MSSASTCRAPSNIAVIKYWGKRDAGALNLPLNSSLSLTLDVADMCAKTTAVLSEAFAEDKLWLNGEEVEVNKRVATVLREVRARAATAAAEGEALRAPPTAGARMVSVNNFPTAAGLASSAAGYACMVATLEAAWGLPPRPSGTPGDSTAIARMGSGSACRSLFGGFVRWDCGTRADGVDSVATQVAPAAHWPDIDVTILVLNAGKKAVSSTSGMQTTCRTSPLLAHRAANVVPARLLEMEAAIAARDFAKFATLTMRDSNQFHATCLDTYPPIFYLNDASRRVIHVVHALNDHAAAAAEAGAASSAEEEASASDNGAVGKPIAAYTFDAGPNAVIFTERARTAEVRDVLGFYFPPPSDDDAATSAGSVPSTGSFVPSPELSARVGFGVQAGLTQRVIVTRVGPGPEVLPESEALADAATGMPL